MNRVVQQCAMVYVIKNRKVLLIKHIKTGSFVGVGGHTESYETIWESAIRETFEESGIQLNKSNMFKWDIFGTPIPLCSYLFDIDSHSHEVFVYIANTDSNELVLESDEGGWYTYEETKSLIKTYNVQLVLIYLKSIDLID
jgi:8-oxo-dGTP pyrophosphatase MutT (NUDIX family)